MGVAIQGPVTGEARDVVATFLRTEGYVQPIHDEDALYASWESSAVVGALRLAREHGVTVLRGMRVRSDLRRQGIGTRLLEAVEHALGDVTCYCLPYPWLTSFYGHIGFRAVPDDEAPAFLVERRVAYARKKVDVVIVRRSPG